MSSNVGLSTPRGSGTSGYVQRNLSVLKPRAAGVGVPYSSSDIRGPPRVRKPDQDILKHDRLREIEVKVLELQERLEDEGELDDDAIDEACEKLRKDLLDSAETKNRGGRGGRNDANAMAKSGRDGIKKYQVHELAEAKIKESDRLRRALGLRNEEVVGENGEGEAEHPMARQERKRREREMEKVKAEEEKEAEARGRDYD